MSINALKTNRVPKVISDVNPEKMARVLGIEVQGEGSRNEDIQSLLKDKLDKSQNSKPPISENIGEIRIFDVPGNLLTSDIIILNQVTNTQDAIEKVATGFDDGDDYLTLTALSQSDGKGYNDRTWFSPEGDLYFSVFKNHFKFFERVDQEKANQRYLAPMMQVICGKLLADSLKALIKDENLFGCSEGIIIRPISDLVFRMREKFAGILIKNVWSSEQFQSVIGVGVNFQSTNRDIETNGITQLTSSLDDILRSGHGIKHIDVINEFVGQLKAFESDILKLDSIFDIKRNIKKTLEDYKAYFDSALFEKAIQIFESDHETLAEEGQYMDIVRDNETGYPLVEIKKYDGNFVTVAPNGIKIN